MAKKPMSDDHKAALATGRSQSRAVSTYLEALEAYKPKRGRKRTADSISTQIEKIDAEINDADPLRRLQLTQKRMDLESEMATIDNKPDMSALEDDFVAAALGYSQSKGISYAAWRSLGVEPAVLKKAGITRSM